MATNFIHWRLRLESSFNGNGGYSRLANFSVRSTAGGPDLSLTNARASYFTGTNHGPSHAIDNNPATYYETEYPPRADLCVTLASGEDLVEFTIQAHAQSASFIALAPQKFSLWGAWTDGAWLKVADYVTDAWTYGETRTFAIPAYEFPKTMEFVGRTLGNIVSESIGDDEVTIAKATAFAVADMHTYSLSKAMTYALTDNLTNGLAKAIAYAVVEEAPAPGQVDGFRMRNAVGRNVIMRGGKGEPPPPPPIHYPPGEIPLEPQ